MHRRAECSDLFVYASRVKEKVESHDSRAPNRAQSPARSRPVILCALKFERAALERANLGAQADIVCCGPGALSVVEWSEREGANRQSVILAGLAAGLRESAPPGAAYLAATIVTPTGRRYRSTFAAELCATAQRGGGSTPVRSAVLAGTDRIITTRQEKRILAEKTSAELADLESAVFAEAATVFGWRWAIVRGVSDGCNDHLPRDIDRWIDKDGRARTLRVMLSLLLRPWSIPAVLRLRRQSQAAMQSVVALVEQVLGAMAGPRTDSAAGAATATERCILVFGGTFDPPHRAHIEIPQRVAAMTGCGEILYVPTSSNPLKGHPPTSAHHRLHMLRLAVREQAHCSISELEVNQAGPAFTVETLEALHLEYPETTWFRLLLGSDSALEFHRWKNPRRILELATPVVMLRPPHTRESLREALGPHWSRDEIDRWMSWIVDGPMMDVSSRELRARLARGEREAPELDAQVLAYIQSERLYGGSRSA